MIDHYEFLEVLGSYIRQLEGVKDSFQKGQGGEWYLNLTVESEFDRACRELCDLCNDHLTANAYGMMISEVARNGLGGNPARTSPAGVQEVLTLAKTIETRVRRTPGLVLAHRPPPASYWDLLHPKVQQLAKARMAAGHYADAVEACFKEVNCVIKDLHRSATGVELDGVDLMRKAFRVDGPPTVLLTPLIDDSAKNIQRGYLDIYAGAMAAIRNPKAHENITISEERAVHLLYLASLLFCRLDEAVGP